MSQLLELKAWHPRRPQHHLTLTSGFTFSPTKGTLSFFNFFGRDQSQTKVCPVFPYWSGTSCLFCCASVFPPVALPACFPRLTPNSCFPALDTGFLFSRAWNQIFVFPRLSLDFSFLALEIGLLFSRAWHWILVFPPLGLDSCFRALETLVIR